MTTADTISELRWRGLIHQVTHEQQLRSHLSAQRAVYAGFDPTADSLTIGNLVPIMLLAHFQRAGHTPVVLMGGGTGLIGDPSGKSAERQLRTPEEVAGNVRSQMRIFSRVLDFAPSTPNHAHLLDNADWLCRLSYIDALRDIGKHFSVNMMMQKDSIKERLNSREQGISYTEFSYMILQAYDFLVLFRDHAAHGLPQPVTIQCGGSDQWGNMVAGADLIRRERAAAHPSDAPPPHSSSNAGGPEDAAAFCLTAPLVTKADGGKFGKSEAGAVWLTAERTSPYAFYQFWLNTADADAVRFLKLFTFLPEAEVTRLETALTADPAKREAQLALASEVTRMLHGADELASAQAATASLFSKGGRSPATADTPFLLPAEVIAAAPSTTHALPQLDGIGLPLVDLLPLTSLAKSKTEARTLLAQNSIAVNGHKAASDARLTTATLLPGNLIALRRGSKTWHITRWE